MNDGLQVEVLHIIERDDNDINQDDNNLDGEKQEHDSPGLVVRVLVESTFENEPSCPHIEA